MKKILRIQDFYMTQDQNKLFDKLFRQDNAFLINGFEGDIVVKNLDKNREYSNIEFLFLDKIDKRRKIHSIAIKFISESSMFSYMIL